MHESFGEIHDQIKTAVIGALAEYKRFNDGKLPSSIFFYRDGVGDGQIDVVHDQEISVVKEGLRECYERAGVAEPKICFVIVSKRINTKFFKVGPLI